MRGNPPIILIGMMLSGKTTIGRLLASRLNTSFIDLDEAIVQTTGKSIAALFESGEQAFRAAEEQAARDLIRRGSHGVIALGGGAFTSSPTREHCLSRGVVVYLEASVAELAVRYRPNTGRPLLDGAGSVEEALTSLLSLR